MPDDFDESLFPDENVAVEALRRLARAGGSRVNGIPAEGQEAFAAAVAVITSEPGRLGLVPADAANPADFRAARVRGVRVDDYGIIQNPFVPNQTEHGGVFGWTTNTDQNVEQVIRFEPSTDPGVGMMEDSVFHFARFEAGPVRYECGPGLTLRNADAHTRMGPRWSTATAIRIGNVVILQGRTAP